MRITDTQGRPVVLITEADSAGQPSIKFYNQAIEKEVKEKGIRIPDYAKGMYGGRRYVSIDDPEFISAFKVFYVQMLQNHGFRLE